MTFEQLLYAEILAQHHSMQKAADALHISKSGLSLAITQLENELGVKLFERSAKGTYLTKKGRQLLASISDILRHKNNLESRAKQIASHDYQKVAIHYMNTLLKPFMTSFIRDFHTKYSHVQFDISCHELDSIIRRLHSQEIDAGFIAIKQSDDDLLQHLIFTPVCDTKLKLICSLDNPLSRLKRPIRLEDLKSQKFSLFNDRFHDRLFDRLQFQGGPLQLVLRVDDAWAMKEAISKLNTVCFGRILQSDLSSNTDFSEFVSIDIGHLIDDNFKLGWLTNPNHMLLSKAQDLIADITAEIQSFQA
ncbi:LysR family transcriptional regulator [Streptococcus orisasini]